MTGWRTGAGGSTMHGFGGTMPDPHAARARAAIDRGAKVASIYRTEREDKVQLDLMQDDPNGARLGGGALLLNIHAGHGLNPGDQVRVRIEHV